MGTKVRLMGAKVGVWTRKVTKKETFAKIRDNLG